MHGKIKKLCTTSVTSSYLRTVLDEADAQLDVAQVIESIDPMGYAKGSCKGESECAKDGDGNE